MLECSIVKNEETRLVGVSFAGPVPDSFPKAAIQLHESFWPRRFEIPGRVKSDVLISPFQDYNESFVTYWACCEVEDVGGNAIALPPGMQLITIPAHDYAMVTCTNQTIGEGYTRLTDWMKQQGFQRVERACMIEKYYIMEQSDAGEAIEERVELLAPIKPRPAETLVERIDAVFLPVVDLEASVAWYQDVFGLKVRWQNNRMAGLAVGSNVGFHLVKVRDWVPSDSYTPINLAARDAEAVRARLKEKHVRLSDWRPGDPVRFDFWDNSGNIICLMQL